MELREHAATVMSTLDQSINSLSDYDNFVSYLHSIGKLHRKVPGFERAHFWVSGPTVNKEELGRGSARDCLPADAPPQAARQSISAVNVIGSHGEQLVGLASAPNGAPMETKFAFCARSSPW